MIAKQGQDRTKFEQMCKDQCSNLFQFETLDQSTMKNNQSITIKNLTNDRQNIEMN